MSNDMEELNQRVEDTNKNLLKLMNALLPNELTNRGGLINDVKKLEESVKLVNTKLDNYERRMEDKFEVFKNEITEIKQWKKEITNAWKIMVYICGGLITLVTIGIQIAAYFKK